jgi:hypothetical protein
MKERDLFNAQWTKDKIARHHGNVVLFRGRYHGKFYKPQTPIEIFKERQEKKNANTAPTDSRRNNI